MPEPRPLPGPAARADVAPFHVMEVLSAAQARQRSHGDVVSMCAGQPSAGAPAPVLEAAARGLREADLGYTSQLGIPALREAIAGHYGHAYGLDVAPEDVIVTTGSSGGFLTAFLAAFDPGDRVAMARPGYPVYRNVLAALGCEVVEFPVGPGERYQPTIEALDELGPIEGLIVASPNNPTGTMLAPGELAAISGWCAARGVQLISDEIYHGISFADGGATDGVSEGGATGETTAWAAGGGEALVLGSFSKYFGMTGWRLGWMLVPRRLHRAVDVLTGNLAICAPAPAQHAAVAAFAEASYAELDARVRGYRDNRDVLLSGLGELGIDEVAPADGAFYAYADVSAFTRDSLSWCQRLLAETGLAITPGIDFDPVDGGRFVRFSYPCAQAEVTECLRRLGAWLGSPLGTVADLAR